MPIQKGIKIIAKNRSAFHNYFIEERFEAGIELCGTEVKSIRAGKVNLKDSFCQVKNGCSCTPCTSPPTKRATCSTGSPGATGGC